MAASFGFLLSLAISSSSLLTSLAVDCISSYDPSQNYFPFAYTNGTDAFALPLGPISVDTAFDFTVQYSKSYKVVRNQFSNQTYILYQCGTPKPSEFTASNSVKLIQIPVNGVGLTGTTPIPYLELLGLINQIKEVDPLGVSPYICSACMQKIISTSEVKSLNPNSSVLVIQDSLTPSISKNYISFDATSDPGPLKRAEWIKFLALFFNQETLASNIFNEIKSNYDCFNGSSIPPIRPVVAWMSYYLGNWTISDKQYKKDLIRDAGGLSLNESLFGIYDMSNPTQAKRFTEILKGIDVLIDETFAFDPPSYTLDTFVSYINTSSESLSFPFLLNKRVWREDRRISFAFSLDWLQTAPAQPQIVLQELIGILNPSITHQPYFFRNLALGEKVQNITAQDCSRDYNQPLKPTIYVCPVSPLSSIAALTPFYSTPMFIVQLLFFVLVPLF